MLEWSKFQENFSKECTLSSKNITIFDAFDPNSNRLHKKQKSFIFISLFEQSGHYAAY